MRIEAEREGGIYRISNQRATLSRPTADLEERPSDPGPDGMTRSPPRAYRCAATAGHGRLDQPDQLRLGPNLGSARQLDANLRHDEFNARRRRPGA
ncbi:MAG: hypothetical protein R2991_04420 [Thermoanaerobaculia bacterium]